LRGRVGQSYAGENRDCFKRPAPVQDGLLVLIDIDLMLVVLSDVIGKSLISNALLKTKNRLTLSPSLSSSGGP